MDDLAPAHAPNRTRLLGILVVVPILYVLSSGPVLAVAFWLREATGWDGFYLAMMIYFPLLLSGPDSIAKAYIEWWVVLFGTVGPGRELERGITYYGKRRNQ